LRRRCWPWTCWPPRSASWWSSRQTRVSECGGVGGWGGVPQCGLGWAVQ
jgi:hypothetical protein